MRPISSLAERASIFCRANHASLRDLPTETFWSAVRALPTQVARTLATSRLTAGLVVAAPTVASAGTLMVLNNNDSGTDSLRERISVAAAGDVVIFDASLNGQTITLTSGQIAIHVPLTITGPGSGSLTIDGGGMGNADAGFSGGSRIFYLYAQTPSPDGGAATPAAVTITGLTLQHGYSGPGSDGGAIAAYKTSVTLDDLTIKDSFAGNGADIHDGAGLFFNGTSGGSLTIRNSTITGNTSQSNGGGSVARGAGVFILYASGSVLIDTCTISGNSGVYGGGLGASQSTGSLTIQNSTVTDNVASGMGGGLFFYGVGVLTITNTTVSGNTAQRNGAGIREFGVQQTVIDRSTISGNTSNPSGRGGGIDIFYGYGTVALTNTTVSGNSAVDQGGGVQLYRVNGVVENCTVTGNSTNEGGGGIQLYKANVVIAGTTISGNTARNPGGGLYLIGSPINGNVVVDSIIAGNMSSNNLDGGLTPNDIGTSAGADQGTLGEVSYSIIETPDPTTALNNGLDGGFTAIGDGGVPGVGNLTGVDPLLGALANNGGPTKTMLPGSGSPAINAGDPNFPGDLSDAGFTAPTTDQRGTGFARVSGGRLDIGAVEVQATTMDGGSTSSDAGSTSGSDAGGGASTDGGSKSSGKAGCACSGTQADLALTLLAPVGALLLRRRRSRA